MRKMRLAWWLLCIGLAANVVESAAQDEPLRLQAGSAVEVELAVDLSHVSLRQADILRRLIEAARVMDTLYQRQMAPGGLYPADLGGEEFDAWDHPDSRHPFTRIERDDSGTLVAVPYHEAWPRELGHAARLLAQAAEITGDEALRHYLTLQARAFITSDYARARAAWLALRGSDLDVVIGPLGTAADRQFGLKSAFGAYVLLRDWEWGAQLARMAVFLPQVQHSLPVSEVFKGEVPDVGGKVGVYDLLFVSGHAGALDASALLGPGREPGTSMLPLRNVMRARYQAIVLPVARTLVAPEQLRHVQFEPWFLNTLLHEMGYRLGVQRTIDNRSTVALALREHADTIEEAKAAVLSLWMAEWLQERGELDGSTRLDRYVSFLAQSFHAMHLDPYTSASEARRLLFNYFRDWGGLRRDTDSGLYRVDEVAMSQAIETLAAQLLTLQGSGDYEGAAALIDAMAGTRPELRVALDQLRAAEIPVALRFVQGEELLGL